LPGNLVDANIGQTGKLQMKKMKRKYGQVTQQTIQELIAILGKDNVSVKKHELQGYSSDEMPLPKPHEANVIVKPTDTISFSKLLAFANKNKIPVTPRGAGTGLSGGCIPIYSGILLSLERLNHIIKIDRANFTATVEPSVTLADLTETVEQQGLYYPIHLGEMTATIGGSVATNAGGTNAVKYGVTRHHVLGLEAVLPNGDIINTGGEFVKCSTGYDLTQLIIGSEGTLAIITKIILRLSTRLIQKEVLFVPFNDLQHAINAVPEILRLKVTPIGLEFMERSIIEIVEKYLDEELPYHQYEAFLMIIMEGATTEEITDYFGTVEQICKQHGAVEAMVPSSERAKRKLLNAREKFYPAIKRFAPMEIIDIVVPRSNIAIFVKKVKKISQEHNVPIIAYGHAGDGNVHLHPICVDMDMEEWSHRLPQIMHQVYQAGISLGGSISGEHGIGFDKKSYLNIEMSQEKLNIMKRIKMAFDPKNILNPGKIFDL
jgi:glycolate oxidase